MAFGAGVGLLVGSGVLRAAVLYIILGIALRALADRFVSRYPNGYSDGYRP